MAPPGISLFQTDAGQRNDADNIYSIASNFLEIFRITTPPHLFPEFVRGSHGSRLVAGKFFPKLSTSIAGLS